MRAGEEALTATFRGKAISSHDAADLTDVDAIGYEIDLAIDDKPSHEAYRATVKGTYVAVKAQSVLELDLEGNHLHQCRSSGPAADRRFSPRP